MNKKDLQSRIKPTVAVYLFWLLLGSHYGYLGRWNIQILFWITLGGLGVWAIIDLIRMSDKIIKHRELIFQQIDEIENKEMVEKNVQYRIEPTPKFKLYNGELFFRQKGI